MIAIITGICIVGIGAWMTHAMKEWVKRDVRRNDHINGDGDG